MIRLAGIINSGMVIQRDVAYKIWGYEDMAEYVFVMIEGMSMMGKVENGQFMIEMPPHEAARNVHMSISGSCSIELTDICFGDVFYLSGQSNMELPVYRTMDVSEEEIRASHYPYIRQYRVTPAFELAEDASIDLPEQPWTCADGEELMQFSAAGFYCAKRIYDEKKVPIGLVLGAQGGSTIEAWMPSSLLPENGTNQKTMAPFMKEGELAAYLQKQEQLNAQWRAALESAEDETNRREIPANAGDFTVPGLLRKQDGNAFTGIVWFYKEVELQQEPSKDAFLYLGNLIDADQTFINGVLVGRTEYRYPPRKYPFDGSILRRGKNLIAVRLLIENGDGGFVGAHPYYLRAGDEQVSIEGDWKIVYGQTPVSPLPVGVRGQVVPTALYKTSVLPLRNYAFRGNWWYQGESNTDEPEGYAEKFQALMSHWRQLYEQTMPLICIEMPDYSDPISGEMPDGWTSIQAQQRQAQQDLPDCVVVSAKDLMTPLELHPQRKSELGQRMAEAALKLYY
ncbi:MAG: hypothetical protein KBT07_00055 [Clostridiales bacterium]|nr:hypothetical protein [Candidatus Scatonaster coprocaballi]